MSNTCNSRQLHFKIKLKDKELLYLYIRKNACSTWKHLFAGVSKDKEHAKDYENLLGFMGKYHKVVNFQDLKKVRNRLLVLRDPLDRFFSGFINQFLMRFDRQTELHKIVATAVGKDISLVTFKEFVDFYILQFDEELIDAHFWTQKSHLAPIKYNLVWNINELEAKAGEFFGEKVGKRYFSRNRNSTSNIPRYDEDSSDITCGQLFAKYTRENKLPSLASLINDQYRKKIEQYYIDDFELLECSSVNNG